MPPSTCNPRRLTRTFPPCALILAFALVACAGRQNELREATVANPAGNRAANHPTARAIAPLSTTLVSNDRPLLRWELRSGADGARVSLCRDALCDRVEQQFDAPGTQATPSAPLVNGIWYWRVEAMRAGVVSAPASPVWQLRVGEVRAAAAVPSALAPRGHHREAGDVNGDGFVDMVVAVNEGGGEKAYVFLGCASGAFDAPPLALIGPRTVRAQSIFEVVGAGDLNGDGYADVIIGAHDDAKSAVEIHVYFGSATGPGERPDGVVRVGAAADAGCNVGLAAVGDVNGDGFTDVLAGIDDPAGAADAAMLFLGGSAGLGHAPATVLTRSGREFSSFGFPVAAAGDVNGDGYADVAVGEQRLSATSTLVYLGGSEGLSRAPATQIGTRGSFRLPAGQANGASAPAETGGAVDAPSSGMAFLAIATGARMGM